ncbi:MAG: cytochrome c oxidase subunit 3 [Sphingomonadales bacterium]|nr:cytochrome c oxidase subunit 3 [Sphingomonadales bacterium]
MQTSEEAKSEALERQPGTNGVWTFVFIDMIVFSLLFIVFLDERWRLPEVFQKAQAGMPFGFGLANTLILLTSSLFMVEAVRAGRAADVAKVRRNLGMALLCGGAFGAIKIAEYAAKIAEGHGPAANSFYSFYFFMTGVHFLHVLGGMIFMGHCLARSTTDISSGYYRRKLENTGLFWHFVDILWLFIFPLIYLVSNAQ